MNTLSTDWMRRIAAYYESVRDRNPADRLMIVFDIDGNRIFAFVDNEPENLLAAAAVDPQGEILLLHADTIFKFGREHPPNRAVSGRDYDLGAFVHQRMPAEPVQLL